MLRALVSCIKMWGGAIFFRRIGWRGRIHINFGPCPLTSRLVTTSESFTVSWLNNLTQLRQLRHIGYQGTKHIVVTWYMPIVVQLCTANKLAVMANGHRLIRGFSGPDKSAPHRSMPVGCNLGRESPHHCPISYLSDPTGREGASLNFPRCNSALKATSIAIQ